MKCLFWKNKKRTISVMKLLGSVSSTGSEATLPAKKKKNGKGETQHHVNIAVSMFLNINIQNLSLYIYKYLAQEKRYWVIQTAMICKSNI